MSFVWNFAELATDSARLHPPPPYPNKCCHREMRLYYPVPNPQESIPSAPVCAVFSLFIQQRKHQPIRKEEMGSDQENVIPVEMSTVFL